MLDIIASSTFGLVSDANQQSGHGHLSYNVHNLGHVHIKPPTNVTAASGVGVDFMCKVAIGFIGKLPLKCYYCFLLIFR